MDPLFVEVFLILNESWKYDLDDDKISDDFLKYDDCLIEFILDSDNFPRLVSWSWWSFSLDDNDDVVVVETWTCLSLFKCSFPESLLLISLLKYKNKLLLFIESYIIII